MRMPLAVPCPDKVAGASSLAFVSSMEPMLAQSNTHGKWAPMARYLPFLFNGCQACQSKAYKGMT